MNQTETATANGNKTLPDGWRWATLREVLLRLETGSRPVGGVIAVAEGVPSLSAEHMTRFGTFDFSSSRFVPKDFYDTMTRGHIQRGDVLVVKDGATTGKVALVSDDFPFSAAVINEHVFLCRPDQTVIEPRWLFYWLWSNEGQALIRANYQGAAIGGINQRFADVVPVPLPPLTEQQRLVIVLGKQMTDVERARIATEVQLKTTKTLPAAYLREIFNSPTAKQWLRRRLSEVVDLLPAKSIATAGDAEVQVVTTACLTEAGFDPAGIKTARMWSNDVADCVINEGEVLIARSNTPELVGRAVMYPGNHGKVVTSDLTIRVLPKGTITSAFLSAYLSFLFLSGHWKERAGGASGSMKKITRVQIQREIIPVPPLSEQQGIMSRFNEKIVETAKMQAALIKQLETVNQLHDALLRRAFRGDI